MKLTNVYIIISTELLQRKQMSVNVLLQYVGHLGPIQILSSHLFVRFYLHSVCPVGWSVRLKLFLLVYRVALSVS